VIRAAIEQRCLHPAEGEICGKPAKTHVRMMGGMSLACDEHSRANKWHITDAHEIGPSCALPDATWVEGGEGESSRCEVDGLNELLEAVSSGKMPPHG
jgi:hypothetical protein